MNGVTLTVEGGQTTGLIGESGSGKSTVGRLALALLAPDRGNVTFEGTDLGTISDRELRKLRAKMTAVFQEPYESLNPRMAVGSTVEEPLVIHEASLGAKERRERVIETLADVALGEDLYRRYPHELSGGQQQRVGIARAIVTRAKFIVLDEPTSSVDLSVRAQILDLLSRLQNELGLAYLFISHDIRTVEHMSDRIAVMYLGKIVETGPTGSRDGRSAPSIHAGVAGIHSRSRSEHALASSAARRRRSEPYAPSRRMRPLRTLPNWDDGVLDRSCFSPGG